MQKIGFKVFQYLFFFTTSFILLLFAAFISINFFGNEELNKTSPLWAAVFVSYLVWSVTISKNRLFFCLLIGFLLGAITTVLGEIHSDNILVTITMITLPIITWESLNYFNIISFNDSVLFKIYFNKRINYRFRNVLDITIIISFLLFILLNVLINSPYKNGALLIFTIAFAVIYALGGYWLFNKDDENKYLLPIIAGLIFATSIETWGYSIPLNVYRADVLYLPIVNLAFFLFLISVVVFELRNGNLSRTTSNILIRSFIILIITCFFLTLRPRGIYIVRL